MDQQEPNMPPPLPPTPPPPYSTGPGPSPSGSSGSPNTLMLVLAYFGILCLVPLLVEKEDADVQWHAKNGLCLFIAEAILFTMLTVLSFVPMVGCVISILMLFLALGVLVLHIYAMIQATSGKRFIVPYVSDYVSRF